MMNLLQRFLVTIHLGLSLSVMAEVTQTIDFETGDLSQVFREVQGPNAELEVVGDVTRSGKHALRTTLTTQDRRAEVTNKFRRGVLGKTNWYAWSIYLPEDFPSDGRFDIVAQFHDFHKTQPAWGKDKRAPSCLVLKHEKQMFGFDLKFQSGDQSLGYESFGLGPYELGEWTDFVMEVNWTHEPDGYLKIWRDGELMVDYSGPTFMDYGAKNGPYFKMGNYKGAANWPGTSPRIIYFDEFRMGDESATLEEMSPPTPRKSAARAGIGSGDDDAR